jgi:DNA-binding MarR family transcriptional regulator
MSNSYTEAQLDFYLELIDRIAGVWAHTFPEIGLHSPEYLYLFIGLYKNRKREISKGEAEDFLTAAGIKSSITKAKVIARAITMGYVREQKSKVDHRVTLVRMKPKLQRNIQEYLSWVIRVISEELNHMQGQG